MRVSATTPWPANAASPWITSGSTLNASGVADQVLLGPHHPLDHRVDRLEVRGVGRQRDRQLLARPSDELPRRPDVVLDVAGALGGVGVDVALELLEDLPERLAHDVGEHVQASAVGHSQHRLDAAGLGGLVEDLVDHRDGALGALEPEALVAQVLRVEEALEGLGRVEPVEDVQLLVDRERRLDPFDMLLDPPLLVGLLDVHVLDADAPAVGVAQHAEQVAQGHVRPVPPHRR